MRALLAFLWLALTITAARGQGVSGVAAPTTLPAGEVQLAQLADLAASVKGVDLEYDATALRGTVTLRVLDPLGPDELWSLLGRVLELRGLSLVAHHGGQSFSIVRTADARPMAPIVEPGEAIAGAFQTVLYECHRVSPEFAAGVVGPLLTPPAGTATVLPQTRMLLLSGGADRVASALVLLERLDSEVFAPATRRVDLAHAAPEALVAMATQVLAKRQLVGGASPKVEFVALPRVGAVLVVAPADQLDALESLIRELDAAPLREQRVYESPRYPAADVADLIRKTLTDAASGPSTMEVVVDALTDTVIVRGTPTDHERIEELLARLEARRAESTTIIRTIALRNRPVEEVLAVIEPLLAAAPESLEAAPVETGTPAATPSEPQAAVRRIQSSGEVQLSADTLNNALLAVGTPRAIDQIERLIRQADVRQPQVMIEVLLVSLTDGQTRDLGVELSKIISAGSTLIRLQSLFGLADLTPESGDTAGLEGEGGTAVVLDPGDFSAVVRALQTVNDGRSLSIPRVLVNNNQDATIDSIAEEPFLSTNASSTVATTSFGGSLSAGTQVTVRPQIASGDHLVLQYSVSLSAFTGESTSASLPPPRQENSLASVATIPDGYTVVIGGIELLSEGDATTKTPLLGDIPLVGGLFRSRSESETRSRFFAFIRASVLRHQTFEDLKYLSHTAATEAGIDDGWPVVEPRIIR